MLLDLHADRRSGRCSCIGIAAGVIVDQGGPHHRPRRGCSACSWRAALRLGLLLSQAGEFGFVLFAQATAAQLITPEAASLVRRGRHPVDGDDAVPDALHRLARSGAKSRRAKGLDGPELSPETQRDRRRLRPLRPDRRARCCMAKRIAGHPDRQEAEMIERAERVRHQGLLWRRHCGIDLLRTAGAETAEVIAVLQRQ